MNNTKVTCIYWPLERELVLCKWATRITMGKSEKPKNPPTDNMLDGLLNARHSPVRVLNFAFLIENIPSNTATHFARHVHAQPYISSLRNDRQDEIDGDNAPRVTPVDMILYTNSEELMTIANKRLCAQASERTREIAQMICDECTRVFPALEKYLVPNCEWHGGVCHEINPCGKCLKG